METQKKKVVVGMSGGVDSSVAAALLLEQGYNVIGVTMKTYSFDEVGGNIGNETSCCGLDAFNDARMVAVKLGIPHYVVDFTRPFEEHVVNNFVNEYLQGRTPNPCIICNRMIKWGELVQKAESLGAGFIATGHYARVSFDGEIGRYIVESARDRNKDQSYALWGLNQEALSKTLFPLGNLTKTEVRALAEKYGLKTAQKEESFEICFIADNNYRRFLSERVEKGEKCFAEGDIVWEGKIVGRHTGYPFYTIGQRSGIGAHGERVYVTSIDSRSNKIMIGRYRDLLRRELTAKEMNLVSRELLPGSMRVRAKVRYKDEATPATLYPMEHNRFRVVFDEAKRAITPGQSVVFYEKERLVGGGVIDGVEPNSDGNLFVHRDNEG
jgi:tRNA-specific 2-thiouridylase